jgi:hypothetical protein
LPPWPAARRTLTIPTQHSATSITRFAAMDGSLMYRALPSSRSECRFRAGAQVEVEKKKATLGWLFLLLNQ